MAVEDNLLQLSDPTSMYLGQGWTNLSPTDENNIQIIHQLSMTTGLDDGVANPDCTDPNCLDYLASPGSRWAYHNAPYTLLHDVLDSALGTTVNNYILNNLTLTTGITGLFLPIGDNEVYFSTPRSMARFGLLALENGIWDGDTILGNMNYIQQMTQPSQSINESYGYLWWLNGQNSHMLPGIQFTFPGYLVPNAPADMFMALGMNDQKIYVVPSSNMVVIRMGNAPSTPVPGPSGFDNELWARLSFLHQQLNTPESIDHPYSIYPSPATNEIRIEGSLEGNYSILDVKGRVWNSGNLKKGGIIDISELPAGQYFFLLENLGTLQKFTKM
jgi:CubicO group peptidase (beta-lactamase class C family)